MWLVVVPLGVGESGRRQLLRMSPDLGYRFPLLLSGYNLTVGDSVA